MGNDDLNDVLQLAFGVSDAKRQPPSFWQRQHAARASEAAHYLRILLELMGDRATAELRGRETALRMVAGLLPSSGGRRRDLSRDLARARARLRPKRRRGAPPKYAAEKDRELLARFTAVRSREVTDARAAAEMVDTEGRAVSEYRRRTLAIAVLRAVRGAKGRERRRASKSRKPSTS